mmetsp:Transcript_28301/g.59948  ORF Transcript_28301/g.59948 Transcript_28301/m.59948 type:complete len:213 (-) Transcript_28301:144-782(-)
MPAALGFLLPARCENSGLFLSSSWNNSSWSMRANCSSVIICPAPPVPVAEAMAPETPLGVALETGYFLPGIRRKSSGRTVGVPLPFVPAGGLGGDTAGLGFGAVTVDAAGRRCPGGCRCAPMALAIPIPPWDGRFAAPLLRWPRACRSSSAASCRASSSSASILCAALPLLASPPPTLAAALPPTGRLGSFLISSSGVPSPWESSVSTVCSM